MAKEPNNAGTPEISSFKKAGANHTGESRNIRTNAITPKTAILTKAFVDKRPLATSALRVLPVSYTHLDVYKRQMVYLDQSLMGALGKTIVFEVIQSLLFLSGYTVNLSSFLSLVIDEDIFTGASGTIETSLGFSIILVLGLANEIRHLHDHQLSHNSN